MYNLCALLRQKHSFRGRQSDVSDVFPGGNLRLTCVAVVLLLRHAI